MSDEPGAIVDALGKPLAPGTEAEAQAKAIEIKSELAKTRVILNADRLAHLVAPRARHEQSFEKLSAHFFTVDGVLYGKKIQGALFAGECMLVYALSVYAAQELANSGLRATIELLHREYETRSLRMDDLSPIEAGLAKEVAGRRSRPPDPRGPLATLPKLRSIIATEIGKLPWTW